MAVLVRTWNVFHGNAAPPQRRAFLEEMVRLVAADRPDVVCLQEVPVWALARLATWSGMTALGAVAARPRVRPLLLGRLVTDLDHGLLRSALTGQANAVLVAPRHRVVESRTLVLNPPRVRRTEARRLRLDLATRLRWAKERRVCQAVRLEVGGGALLVANLHATGDERLADAELARAVGFLEALVRPGEALVLAGDANVLPGRSAALRGLAGFSEPLAGIDQVLVRGLPARATAWPEERRRLGGRVLSDHAPVEAVVGCGPVGGGVESPPPLDRRR